MDEIITSYKVVETFSDGAFSVTENGIVYQNDLSKPYEYGHDYYKRYQDYRGSATSACLIRCRSEMVARFGAPPVLDVGIGSGEFLESLNAEGIRCFGFDINPIAVSILKDRGDFLSPVSPGVQTATFWDTLEHIPDPATFLSELNSPTVLISIPILDRVASINGWKHFKPGEHLYYFTEKGLVAYMKDVGYNVVYSGRPEERCGRQDIGSFAFKRR